MSNKSEIKDLKKNVDECFKRVGKTEKAKAQTKVKLDSIYKLFNNFMDTFEKHDEKEMEKYNAYDKHVQELNETMIIVKNGIEDLKTGQSSQKTSIENLDTDFKTFKTATNDELQDIRGYINKALGGLLVICAIGVAIFQVWSYMEDKLSSEQSKNKQLEARYQKMENLMNRNYGMIQNTHKGKADGNNGND